MAVEKTKTVDAIGIEKNSDSVILTIADQLDWSSEQEHLLLLQEKINAYLGFIESGEMIDAFPQAQGRPIAIQVITRYPIPDTVLHFFEKAKNTMIQAGIGFKYYQWCEE